MKINKGVYNVLIKYFFIYFIFINFFFLFFQVYLFLSKVYIFNGDIYHGISSYLLILHSTLAITSSFFYYIPTVYIMLYFFYNNTLRQYLNTILNIISFVAVYISYHILIFLLTGIIWSDYSWGFLLSIEYRTIKLCLLFLIYILLVTTYLFFRENIIYVLMIFMYLIVFMFVFDTFIVDVYKGISEIHQNESSLHLFLLSISGSYMFSIFILISYLVCLLLCIILSFLYISHRENNNFKNDFYKLNISNN